MTGEKFIIKGPIVEDNVKMSVGELLWQTADKFGNRICQIHAYTSKQETFDEVRKRALRVAIQMRKMGVKKGEVVMNCCDNDLDSIVPTMATLFLGGQVVNSVPFLERYVINIVKPKIIFATNDQINLVEEAIESLKIPQPQLCVVGLSVSSYPNMYHMEQHETAEELTFQPVKVDVHDTAFILFSSGTTSMPKAICLSHFSALAGSCRFNGDQKMQIDHPMIMSVTMYWVSSVWLTLFCIVSAQPKIVGPAITGEKFYQLIDQYKIVNSFLSYAMWVAIVSVDKSVTENYDLSSMRYLVTGGAHVDPKYIRKLRNIFPTARVTQSYASTEMGCAPTQWTFSDMDAYNNKLHSIGTVNCNVQIKVVDVKSRQPLGPNQEGEILVKSPYRMVGFSEEDSSDVFDQDGFLKSGDLGYYDEQGYFFIVDRLNEIFKSRSIRIAPNMVEEVLGKHDAVQEAVVFGVPHAVDMFHPAACVTLNHDVSIQELSDHIVQHMAELYRPIGGIKVLREMPRTANGKIARREVKRLFMQNSKARETVTSTNQNQFIKRF